MAGKLRRRAWFVTSPSDSTGLSLHMKPRVTRRALVVAAACATLACGSGLGPTAPEAAVSSSATASRGSDVVGLLKRTERLHEHLAASAVIGRKGGYIQIPRAGIRIDFPRGAVSKPTRITVIALRGRNVAYRFEPHGIAFEAPVTIRQSLRNTQAWNDSRLAADLQGSYFDRLLVDPSETYARSYERRGGRLQESGRMLEFSIEHFSGYMVSWGKGGIEMDAEVDITSR